jgi:hypothetical protein
VVATTVAVPLAAASVLPAALVFDVVPLVEVDTLYGSATIRISNTSLTDFGGPPEDEHAKPCSPLSTSVRI